MKLKSNSVSKVLVSQREIFLATSNLCDHLDVNQRFLQTVKISRRYKAVVIPSSLIYVFKKSNILLITTKHSAEKPFKIFKSEWFLHS